ncbi:MAG: hypothetical protein HYR63_13220 [Proteobacteria bacterium]|nr:hypothetical protein [Pseudomonadota bacterium]MBI3496943.1 hypothetical protein [Pseudomonadota bacterium]
MGIRANTQNAISAALPWFEADLAFGTVQLPPAHRPSSEELARSRREIASFLKSHPVTHCPTRYATITQACVPPAPPEPYAKPRRSRSAPRRSH